MLMQPGLSRHIRLGERLLELDMSRSVSVVRISTSIFFRDYHS